MIHLDRRLALLGLAALAGCGFTPAYAPGGPAAGLRGKVLVDAPADAAGYRLVQRLEERLGRPEAPRYRLAADIRLGEEGTGITPDQTISRYMLRAEAGWRLEDGVSGTVLRSGTARALTGYTATSTTVATRSAREDALERLMTMLADRIVAALIADPPPDPAR